MKKSSTGRETTLETSGPELLENARNSLLELHSSKSTNQAAIILGLAIVALAVIPVYDKFSFYWSGITFLAISIGTLVFFGVHALGKLIAYGILTSAIQSVTPQEPDELIKKAYSVQSYPSRIMIPSLCLRDFLLKNGKDKGNPLYRFYRFTQNKLFKLVYFIAFVLVLLWLLIYYNPSVEAYFEASAWNWYVRYVIMGIVGTAFAIIVGVSGWSTKKRFDAGYETRRQNWLNELKKNADYLSSV